MIARVAANLERTADADETTELPAVLRIFPYREALDLYAYAVIASDAAGTVAGPSRARPGLPPH